MQTALSRVETASAVAVKVPLPSKHRSSSDCGQGLGEILYRHLFPLFDPRLCSNLYRLVCKLDEASIGEASVVDVAEHRVEGHLLPVAVPELNLEAVDHEDPDQPVQLLLRHLLPQFTGVPCHLHTVLLKSEKVSKSLSFA